MSALFYGKSGTGKTTLACSFPKPLLLLDINERGTESVVDVEGVDLLSIDSYEDIENIYWYLKESNDNGYKTVVLDQLTTMQDLALSYRREMQGKDPEALLTQKDWGVISGMMKTDITNFRDLTLDGINVVFNAHDRMTEPDDEDTSDRQQIDPSVGPRVMPSLATHVAGAVSIIANTYIREVVTKPKKLGERAKRSVEYAARVGPHGYYVTKIRKPKSEAVPEYVADPTYDKLLTLQKQRSTTTRKKRTIRKRK